jgi:hypothetical protein
MNEDILLGIFSMKIPFSGGCSCGAIRYECSAEPIMTFKCHCRDCQRVTGGGFVAGFLVPTSAFRWTIQAGSVRKWSFSFQTPSPGIK